MQGGFSLFVQGGEHRDWYKKPKMATKKGQIKKFGPWQRPKLKVGHLRRIQRMETQCVYDSVSPGTYYGGVVKSSPNGEGKEERSGLGMTGRPADYHKNITF